MIITIAIVLGFILHSCREGAREYNHYKMNAGSAFRYEAEDKRIKAHNAIDAVILMVITCVLFNSLFLIPSLLAIRLIFLDGVLNVKRNLNFWAVGVRDFTGKIFKGNSALKKIIFLVLMGGVSYLLQTEFIKSLIN